MSEASRLKATVYVGGLDNAVNETNLADAFLPFGEVIAITIPKPELLSSSDPHRGFGYVEFEGSSDAKEAIANMDQSELFGRIIKVAAARPQKESSEGLGSRTAVWEQEAWLAKHAVSDEDKSVMANTSHVAGLVSQDPMEGYEPVDVAGPSQP